MRVCICTLHFLIVLVMAGCMRPLDRAEHIAAQAGLEPMILPGVGFEHEAFAAVRGQEDFLVVFIDGDGSPWGDSGRRVADDPSAREPLALELAARTPGSVVYLSRPCYLNRQVQAGCAQKYWTSERYSDEIVASMVHAATEYAQQHRFTRVLLVGYSGGGTIAALMGREMPLAVGVVTIAGNLDPDEWTRLHGYLPLAGSRNPATEPALPQNKLQWHLIGAKDTNVPYSAAQRYLERVPADRVWRYAKFDHACCWIRAWPAIFAQIRPEFAEETR
jgi:poly(3-hydroxybutyrate) depolymerase